MIVPAEQSFVPVITGGDVGAYSLAREFHEAYGVITASVPTRLNRNLRHSRLLQPFPAGSMVHEGPAIEALLRTARQLNGASGPGAGRPLLLLSSYDYLLEHAVRNRGVLEEHGYTVPYPDAQRLEQAGQKERFYALCEKLGVPYPRTAAYDCALHTPAAARAFTAERVEAAGIAYPLILKAGDGGAWADVSFPGRRKVHRVEDGAELTGLLTAAAEAGYRKSLIVQELVPGPDSQMRVATFFRDGTGTVRLSAYGEVIVEDHSPGLEGDSRGILVAQDQGVQDQGVALLEALDWRGFAMFDLKVDPRDGVARFLEMNPRLGRNHFYLTVAGANPAPYLVEEFLQGGSTREPVLTQGPALSTTLPMPLVRRYATADQWARIEQARRTGRIGNPFRYRADTDLRKIAYHRAVELKSYRVYHRHPPPAA